MVVVVVMLIFGGSAKYFGGVGDVVINHLFGFCSLLWHLQVLSRSRWEHVATLQVVIVG
jgi:hypothetical protein